MVEQRVENTAKESTALDSTSSLPARESVFSRVGNRLATVGAITTLATAAFPEKAHAVLEPNGANDSLYINLALPYSSSMAFVNIFNTSGGFFTYSSGVFLNSTWVLTAAHSATDASGNVNSTVHSVFQGSDLTGTPSFTPALGSWIYPGFNNSGNTPDLMLIHLASPVNAPTLSLGFAGPDSVVTTVGFGMFGTPNTGLSSNDGNARGFQARVDSLTFGPYSSLYYSSTDFGFNNINVSLNGRGAPGDSGSPVFNSSGQLVGILSGGSSGIDPDGFGNYSIVDRPEITTWMQNIINNNSVPEPSTFALTGLGTLAALYKFRRRNS